MIETYRGVVRADEMDHMGHMNVQYYVRHFDDATWHLFSALGLTNAHFRDNMTGMAAVQQNITYKAEAMAGDLLVCRSGIVEVKAKTIRFTHVMRNSETGTELAVAHMVGAHLDRQLRKSCPLPAFVSTKALEIGSGAE